MEDLLQDFKFKYGIFGSVSACTIAMFKSSNHLSFSSSLVAAIIKDLDKSFVRNKSNKKKKKKIKKIKKQKMSVTSMNKRSCLFAVND